MKVLISKFENTFHSVNGLSSDVDKIKEFQQLGNLFGLFIEDKEVSMNTLSDQYGLVIDFLIKKDGTLLFKEGFQYFDYEPFEKEIVETILYSLDGDFKANIITQDKSIKFNRGEELKNDVFNCILIENCDVVAVMKQLKDNFGDEVSLSNDNKEIRVYSKKGCIDKSVDVLCGLKNLKIDDVNVIVDHYHNIELMYSVDNLYALTGDNESSKEIYVVNSLSECVDDILSDSSFFILSKNRN